MKLFMVTILGSLLVSTCAAESTPMIAYTALSDAAKASGQLSLYDDVVLQTAQLELDGHRLDVKLPERARAYDVIPVRYTLSPTSGDGRLAVSAVASEDHSRAKDRALYDLTIPGNLNVNIEYLGSICADYLHDDYIPLTADPNTPISPFPPYKRDPFVRSSTIRAADAVWFKFRLTNTGDTILDPEGFGASFSEPYLYKFDEKGEEMWRASPVNLFVRQLESLYPGESTKFWVNFQTSDAGIGLHVGTYRLDMRMIGRFYEAYDWMVNIWAGAEYARLEVPLTVAATPRQTPVEATFVQTQKNRMPGYFSAFEEFMVSFQFHEPTPAIEQIEEILYLQVAPWTTHVVVKLITADPQAITVAKLPIEITDETLAIQYNPDNVMVVETERGKEPVFISMSMPAMRSGFQLGPYPEVHMYEFLKEQKDLGVNVITNTGGDWWIPEISGFKGVNLSAACYKYFYDVLIRQLDMKVVGWSLYPPSGEHWYVHAEQLLGRKLEYVTHEHGYVVNPGSVRFVDMADPAVSEMTAAWVIYQYQRWGDTWYRTADGRMPIDLEDSWGWLRDDINGRYGVGPLTLERFQQWLNDRYGDIQTLNRRWQTDFTSFDQIDPQKGQRIALNLFVYDNPDHVFHEWNTPLEEWDIFRTQLKLELLQQVNAMIQKVIPGAEIAPRTEGANLTIRGRADGDNMHMRHVYYSQRRNAMVFDVLKEMDVVHFYSDYTTLPYSDAGWRAATREMVEAGIIPMLLPQFEHMRDILLNDHYGTDYKIHYNLDVPSKGIMIHRLMAAYPWWKATYEEGGAPGIIWSDYLCSGFATETQKRELKLLTERFRTMTNDTNK